MRLLPKFRQSKTYDLLKRPKRWVLADKPYLLPIFGLVFGIVAVAIVVMYGNHKSGYRPSQSHVVFIEDNGKQETVDTREVTVGDLLHKLPLNLIPQDVVEPSPGTKIIEDNFRINIYRARPVTVVLNGKKVVTLTGERSARVIAAAAGLTVNPEDSVTFASGQISQGVIGEEVIVVPSKPVNLNLYGTPAPVRTLANTVGELLNEKGIKLADGDSVKPSLNTPITPNMQVFVLRKGTQLTTVPATVAAPTEVVNDPNLTFGISVVRQPGSPGKRLITYEIDKKGKKIQIQSATIVDPVPEIIARGTNVDIPKAPTVIMADAGISPSDYPYVNFIVSSESGWCATKWQGEWGSCPGYQGTPTSSYVGYGLCQSTPGWKMASAGADWGWNPVTQMRWCASYAQRAYGGWANAYYHWLANHNW